MASRELAGGDPLRLMLLGEKLVAFRDHAGRVGVMDHRCPHRCASLFYGRNEEGGIRCVYPGWKFDADGKKTSNMKFVKITLNDQIIHENVEMKGPTPTGLTGREAATGPIMFQGDHGPVSYRNIRVTPK